MCAARPKWWQDKANLCEDKLARALTAHEYALDLTLYVRAMQRRGEGYPENHQTALQSIDFIASVLAEHLAHLRAERGALNEPSLAATGPDHG